MAHAIDDESSVSSRRGFLVAASALLATGCFGTFGATNALYDFNKGVSENKWLQWLVFLVLIILPVYGLFILADAIVLNTIEFFTGNNPIGGSADLGDGHTLRSSGTDDPNLVKHEIEKDGKVVRTVYVRRVSDTELSLLDDHKHAVGSARVLPDGSVQIVDGEGNVQSTIEQNQVDRVSAALEMGASPSRAVTESLQLPISDTRVASL
jgi:hypothetical protein